MDLRSLPKVRDSLSYVYLEHGKLEQDMQGVCFIDEGGKTQIPCSAFLVIMIGPGCSVTHAAIKNLANLGCLVFWVGEESVRFYAVGLGETRSSQALLHQAKLVSDSALRTKIATRLYRMRFSGNNTQDLTIDALRGKEGARVKHVYARLSARYGVEWRGRSYNRNQWNDSSPINKAISCANACLYGVCHAAIVSLGLAPGLGFIHTGKQLSFVYDIADIYKEDFSLDVAFKVTKEMPDNLERSIRKAMRDQFADKKLLKRMVKDLEKLLDLSIADSEFDRDPALPGWLNTETKPVYGGQNYDDPNP